MLLRNNISFGSTSYPDYEPDPAGLSRPGEQPQPLGGTPPATAASPAGGAQTSVTPAQIAFYSHHRRLREPPHPLLERRPGAGGRSQRDLRRRCRCVRAAPEGPLWDKGADETIPLALYRSVGTNAGNLNTSSRTVAISDTTATFSGSMPANIGVGDVLQYQVPPAVFYLAFIQDRVSDIVYTVRSSTGQRPQAAAAGTTVDVYRAYTSLSGGRPRTTTRPDNTVGDFDTSRDLVTSGVVMMAAATPTAPCRHGGRHPLDHGSLRLRPDLTPYPASRSGPPSATTGVGTRYRWPRWPRATTSSSSSPATPGSRASSSTAPGSLASQAIGDHRPQRPRTWATSASTRASSTVCNDAADIPGEATIGIFDVRTSAGSGRRSSSRTTSSTTSRTTARGPCRGHARRVADDTVRVHLHRLLHQQHGQGAIADPRRGSTPRPGRPSGTPRIATNNHVGDERALLDPGETTGASTLGPRAASDPDQQCLRPHR